MIRTHIDSKKKKRKEKKKKERKKEALGIKFSFLQPFN